MLRTKFGSRRAVLAASSEQVEQKSTRVQRPELHIRNQGSAVLRERCWCSWHKCSPYQCPRRHLPCSHAAEEDNGVQEASLCRTHSISKQSCPFFLASSRKPAAPSTRAEPQSRMQQLSSQQHGRHLSPMPGGTFLQFAC